MADSPTHVYTLTYDPPGNMPQHAVTLSVRTQGAITLAAGEPRDLFLREDVAETLSETPGVKVAVKDQKPQAEEPQPEQPQAEEPQIEREALPVSAKPRKKKER